MKKENLKYLAIGIIRGYIKTSEKYDLVQLFEYDDSKVFIITFINTLDYLYYSVHYDYQMEKWSLVVQQGINKIIEVYNPPMP